MKNRNGKKSFENRIAQIAALAYRVNRETPHSVFCDFSGHVNLLCVSIHLGGWAEGKEPDISYRAYTSGYLMEFGGLSRIRAKLILDAMTKAAYWQDDKQVYNLNITKFDGPIGGLAVVVLQEVE